MGRIRPWAMRWLRKGRTPAPGDESLLAKENAALARDRRWWKWWLILREGENQYPSHLTTCLGRKSWPSRAMGAWEGGVLWLGVRQWISSVLGVENSTLMSFALEVREAYRLWRRLTFVLLEVDATVREKSST